MKKVVSILIGLFFTTTVCLAQGVSPTVKQKTANAEKELQKIEKLIGKMEKSAVISDRDGEELIALMDRHAELMGTALHEALKETEREAKAKEKTDKKLELKTLKEYERIAKVHEKRAAKIEQRARGIHEKVRKGEIGLGKGTLKKMSPKEKKEFMEFVDPNTRKKYKEKHKDVFSASDSQDDTSGYALLFPTNRPATPNTASSWLDFLISPAHSAIGVTAGGSCTTAVACGAGAVLAVWMYNQATNDWKSCKSKCSRWNRWCHAKCYSWYLAKCA